MSKVNYDIQGVQTRITTLKNELRKYNNLLEINEGSPLTDHYLLNKESIESQLKQEYLKLEKLQAQDQ